VVGLFAAPTGNSSTLVQSLFPSPAAPPRQLRLDTRIAETAVAKSKAWLKKVEKRWNVRPNPRRKNWFYYTRRKSRYSDPLSVVYGECAKKEPWLKDLAVLFQDFQEKNHPGDRRWLLRSVISYVRSFEYEFIPEAESKLDIRAPLDVLLQRQGDCDSLSVAAGSILKRQGFEVGIVSSKRMGHSVLGIVMPGRQSGTSIRAKGKVYTLVEMTSQRPIGNVSKEVRSQTDWVVAPIR